MVRYYILISIRNRIYQTSFESLIKLHYSQTSRIANRLKGEAETRVRDACIKVGGEYHCDDLYQVVALGKSVRRVALDRFYNEGSLYELRKKYYKEMHRRLFK